MVIVVVIRTILSRRILSRLGFLRGITLAFGLILGCRRLKQLNILLSRVNDLVAEGQNRGIQLVEERVHGGDDSVEAILGDFSDLEVQITKLSESLLKRGDESLDVGLQVGMGGTEVGDKLGGMLNCISGDLFEISDTVGKEVRSELSSSVDSGQNTNDGGLSSGFGVLQSRAHGVLESDKVGSGLNKSSQVGGSSSSLIEEGALKDFSVRGSNISKIVQMKGCSGVADQIPHVLSNDNMSRASELMLMKLGHSSFANVSTNGSQLIEVRIQLLSLGDRDLGLIRSGLRRFGCLLF